MVSDSRSDAFLFPASLSPPSSPYAAYASKAEDMLFIRARMTSRAEAAASSLRLLCDSSSAS